MKKTVFSFVLAFALMFSLTTTSMASLTDVPVMSSTLTAPHYVVGYDHIADLDEGRAVFDGSVAVRFGGSITDVIEEFYEYSFEFGESDTGEVTVDVADPPEIFGFDFDRVTLTFQGNELESMLFTASADAASIGSLREKLVAYWGETSVDNAWLGQKAYGILQEDETGCTIKVVRITLPEDLTNSHEESEAEEGEAQREITDTGEDGIVIHQICSDNSQISFFEIEAPKDRSCYIYMDHITDSDLDCSILVSAGNSIRIDISEGMYILYYAAGEQWEGLETKFGDETAYYRATDFLKFYVTGNTMHGHTVSLNKIIDGNFETVPIDADEFPG